MVWFFSAPRRIEKGTEAEKNAENRYEMFALCVGMYCIWVCAQTLAVFDTHSTILRRYVEAHLGWHKKMLPTLLMIAANVFPTC